MFFKNEKEKCFAYLSHTACDKNNFILDFHITPGKIHDSVAFSDLYKKLGYVSFLRDKYGIKITTH